MTVDGLQRSSSKRINEKMPLATVKGLKGKCLKILLENNTEKRSNKKFK
jgi:hypothetical protein